MGYTILYNVEQFHNSPNFVFTSESMPCLNSTSRALWIFKENTLNEIVVAQCFRTLLDISSSTYSHFPSHLWPGPTRSVTIRGTAAQNRKDVREFIRNFIRKAPKDLINEKKRKLTNH